MVAANSTPISKKNRPLTEASPKPLKQEIDNQKEVHISLARGHLVIHQEGVSNLEDRIAASKDPESVLFSEIPKLAEISDRAAKLREVLRLFSLAHDYLGPSLHGTFIADVRKHSGIWKKELLQMFETAFAQSDKGKKTAAQSVALKELSDDPSETEVAQLYAKNRSNLCFDSLQKDWLEYEAKQPGVFTVKDGDAVFSDVVEFAVSKHRKGFRCSFLKGVVELARVDKRILTSDLRAKPDILVFENEAVRITESGVESIPHSPENRARWALARANDPTKDWWEPIAEFLRKGLKNPKDQDCLIAFHAAVVRNLHTKMGGNKSVLVQRGKSGHGKSTSTNLLTSVIGSRNIMPIESLPHLQENQFALEGLEDYPRVIMVPDQSPLPPRYSIDKILSLTGGDLISVNRKNRKAAKFQYDGAMIINCTESIFSQYHLERGMERRSVYISSWRYDPSLRGIEKRFTADVLAAYTNFLLSLPESFIIETLMKAPGSPNLSEQSQDDPVVRWFASHVCVTNDKTDCVQLGRDKENGQQLYGNYWQSCQKIGVPISFIKTHAKFGDEFRRILNEGKSLFGWQVYDAKPNNKTTFYGIALKADPDDSIFEYDNSDSSYQSCIQQALKAQFGSEPEPEPTEPEPTDNIEPEKPKEPEEIAPHVVSKPISHGYQVGCRVEKQVEGEWKDFGIVTKSDPYVVWVLEPNRSHSGNISPDNASYRPSKPPKYMPGTKVEVKNTELVKRFGVAPGLHSVMDCDPDGKIRVKGHDGTPRHWIGEAHFEPINEQKNEPPKQRKIDGVVN